MLQQNTESILVCIDRPDFAKELTAVGKRLSQERNLPLQVVNIQPSANGYHAQGRDIEILYQICKEAGGELTVLFNDDAAATAALFAKKAGARHIVTRLYPEDSPQGSFAEDLHRLIPAAVIFIVSPTGKVYHIYPNYPPAFLRQASSPG